ncbi:MAG: L,D-transpeptidase family protein [Bacteroidota bacterium]
MNDTAIICSSEFHYFDTLCYYYRINNYKPVFTEEIYFNDEIDSVLRFFENSKYHGLNPEYFDLEFIRKMKSDFIDKILNDSIIDYEKLTNIELALSNALLNYVNGIQYGFIDPYKIFPRNYLLPLKVKDSTNYFHVFKTDNIKKYLTEIQPKSKRYLRLQKSLILYSELRLSGEWDSIKWKDPDIKIELGDTSEVLNSVAKRLLVTGELDSIHKDKIFLTYDSILFEAVKYYQEINGLLYDGVIGRRTLEQMNVSLDDRIKQIAANLERFRWYDYPDTGQYVMVNIPEYYLYGFDNGNIGVSMKVCVGGKIDKNYDERLKRYLKTKKKWDKPENHETPCMYGLFSHFILNPKWLVPMSIADKETIYKIVRDSNYIKDQNYTIFEDGIEINPDSINWEKYTDRSVPFRFQQEPGVLNALGKIKFIFPNKFDVYLHDTPSRAKFQSSFRAVSHGCIRIQSPLDFAEFLIKNNEKLHIDDIRLHLGMKPEDKEDEKKYKKRLEYYKENRDSSNFGIKTKTIFLKQKIPVYVDYYTCWVDDNNILQLRMDVYEKDKKIITNLKL